MEQRKKKVSLTPEEIAALQAAGEAKRLERAAKKAEKEQQPRSINTEKVITLQSVTQEMANLLEKTKEVELVLKNVSTPYTKKDFLSILYYLIIQKKGNIKDAGVDKIMNFFDWKEFANSSLRKRYIQCISAALRQRQVTIKEEMAKFVIEIFSHGYVDLSILITMLEGEYISLKVFEILNDDKVAQTLIESRMGFIIIGKIESIIENGGNICVWTKQFTPTTEVKKHMLVELLGKYKKCQQQYEIDSHPHMLLEDYPA